MLHVYVTSARLPGTIIGHNITNERMQFMIPQKNGWNGRDCRCDFCQHNVRIRISGALCPGTSCLGLGRTYGRNERFHERNNATMWVQAFKFGLWRYGQQHVRGRGRTYFGWMKPEKDVIAMSKPTDGELFCICEDISFSFSFPHTVPRVYGAV